VVLGGGVTNKESEKGKKPKKRAQKLSSLDPREVKKAGSDRRRELSRHRTREDPQKTDYKRLERDQRQIYVTTKKRRVRIGMKSDLRMEGKKQTSPEDRENTPKKSHKSQS